MIFHSFAGKVMKNFLLTVIALWLIATPLWGQWRDFCDLGRLRTEDTVTVAFIGDVMQHGGQITAAHAKGLEGKSGAVYDFGNSFKYLYGRLQGADFAVANMEFTVGEPPFTGYPAFSAPPDIAKEAFRSGVDLFLLANNHIADKGSKGLKQTLEAYERMGVMTTGAYKSSEDQQVANPLYVTLKGVKVAFINFTYGLNLYLTLPYRVNLQDSTFIVNAIRKAKKDSADIIIALPHWGTEYRLKPDAQQIKLASLMLREGVDAIIGSHPHVPQEGYVYERVVFFSLGNYVSNQSIPPYTQVGMIVRLHIVKNVLTQRVTKIFADREYTWCFRRGEFEKDYVVVPIEEFMKRAEYQADSLKHPVAFEKMKKTYNFILEKNLVHGSCNAR